MIYVFIN